MKAKKCRFTLSCSGILVRTFYRRRHTVDTCHCSSSRMLVHKPHTCQHTCHTFALQTRFPCTSSWKPSCTCQRNHGTSSYIGPLRPCPSAVVACYCRSSSSCIPYNKPRRPLHIRCSSRYMSGIAGSLTLKKWYSSV